MTLSMTFNFFFPNRYVFFSNSDAVAGAQKASCGNTVPVFNRQGRIDGKSPSRRRSFGDWIDKIVWQVYSIRLWHTCGVFWEPDTGVHSRRQAFVFISQKQAPSSSKIVIIIFVIFVVVVETLATWNSKNYQTRWCVWGNHFQARKIRSRGSFTRPSLLATNFQIKNSDRSSWFGVLVSFSIGFTAESNTSNAEKEAQEW